MAYETHDGREPHSRGRSVTEDVEPSLQRHVDAWSQDELDPEDGTPLWPRLSGLERLACTLWASGVSERQIRTKLKVPNDWSLELGSRADAQWKLDEDERLRKQAGGSREHLAEQRRLREEREWLSERLRAWVPGEDPVPLLATLDRVADAHGRGKPAQDVRALIERGLERRVGARMDGSNGRFYRERLLGLIDERRYVALWTVCPMCHVVFSRTRRDPRHVFCSSTCKDKSKRLPTVPDGCRPLWRVGGRKAEKEGRRFAATQEDVRVRELSASCQECGDHYWRRDDSHRLCNQCGSGAGRVARTRRKEAGR